jgi:hypothetical protein
MILTPRLSNSVTLGPDRYAAAGTGRSAGGHNPYALDAEVNSCPLAADIVRIEDGVLVEHWDVIEDEATREHERTEPPVANQCSKGDTLNFCTGTQKKF